jgi:hypothetical protein
MKECNNEHQYAWPLVSALGAGILAVTMYGSSQANPGQFISVALFVAGAASALGIFIGFLFGIPRSAQKESQTGGVPVRAQGSGEPYTVNTNLEQISDWLTKIIVGVGLVQIKDLPSQARIWAEYVSSSFGSPTVPSAVVLLIAFYFAVFSFLVGYLWTRLYLAGEFSKAEREAREKPEYYEGVVHAFLYQPMPGGFTGAIEKGKEYNELFGGNSERIWTYLACAYAQQHDYLSRAPKRNEEAIKQARNDALEAIQRAIQINPKAKIMLASMWEKEAQPGEDDLTVFYDDSDFQKILR